ncbi:MAG: HYR domain-containing protein, partial [Bacteroidia bacterium]|nr:HYR domain-containing protein [Bacteroidia bacterium]
FVQTITVNDHTAPVITTSAGTLDATLECSNLSGITAALALVPSATDNCTVTPTIHLVSDVTTPDISCANAYVRVRTWNFTDGCGNTSDNFVQTITVNDHTAPVITTTAGSLDASLECSNTSGITSALALVPSATDNCTASPAIHLVSDVTTPDISCANAYVRVRTWNFTDGCGNTSDNFVQTITVNDVTNPIISCPGDVTINCQDPSNPANTGTATATDNCTASPVITHTDVIIPGICSGNYTISRTWKATDDCGNYSTCLQTITVHDITNPTIVCPAPVIVEPNYLNCSATGINLGLPQTHDNCSVDYINNNAPAIFLYGTTNVIWMVTDGCGNTATCSQTVTVSDHEPPTISCVPLITVSNDPGYCHANVPVPVPVTGDNCGVASVINNFTGTGNASGIYPVGTTIITWTVTDIHGNTSTCSTQVVVLDNEAPIISCPLNISILVPPCTPSYYVHVPPALVSDNCGVLSVVNSFNGTADASGTYTGGVTKVIWTVTDIHGNTSTCVMEVVITDMELTFNINDLNCFDDYMGSAGVTVTDGMPPFTYLWSNGETTQSIDSLAAGNYTVTVTDACGTIVTGTAVVGQPYAPLHAGTITGHNISCYGANDGYFLMTAAGGLPPYAFSIDNINFVYVDTFSMGYLPPATYWVSILDANNCVIIVPVVIHEPDPLVPSAVISNIDCNGNHNGMIDLTITGGTPSCTLPAYTVLWSNGATTQDLSGLAPGTYSVTVIDTNGCTTTATYTITQPDALSIVINSGNISCYGVNIGAINILVSGGTSPYTYHWNNGSTIQNLTGLPSGNYSVTVTDANGCHAFASATINQSSPVTIDLVSTGNLCYGQVDGTIAVSNISALVPPVTYQWSNGSTAASLTGIGAGNYCVVVTDSNGCIGSGCENVTAPASPVSMTAQISNVNCYGGNDGIIAIHAFGGTLPYYGFTWSGITTVGCNTVVIPGASTFIPCCSTINFTVDDLQAGTYYFTVTDANHCIGVDTFVVEQPAHPLHIDNAAITDVDVVAGISGAVNIFVCCGTFPYTYWWENANGDWVSSAEDLFDVPAGTYTVTVTDANGCTATGSYTVHTNALPDWNYYNTGYNHTIYVPLNAVPFLETGDYIGVFYDSLGTLACGGYTRFQGQATSIAAWGEDGIVPNTGFDPGEVFTFKFWKLNTGAEYFAKPVYNLTFPQDSTFVVDGLSGLLSLTPYTVLDSQLVDLRNGWNIMSTYLLPVHSDIGIVFNPVITNVVIVKDWLGNVLWPAYSLNLIGNMTLGQGYKVKMSSSRILAVYGYSIVPEFTHVNIPSGWSILGYLRKSPAQIQTVMNSIVNEIIIMKDQDGYVYWPQLQINSIGNMLPGRGYQIKLATPQIFFYPPNGMLGPLVKNTFDYNTRHFAVFHNTGVNMTVGIPLYAWNVQPDIGDEVAAFSPDGKLVGSTVFDGGSLSLAIWGDDDQTGGTDGMIPQSIFTLKLWHIASATEEQIVVELWQTGNDRFTEDGISIVEKLDNIIPQTPGYSVYQNMPNPFSVNTSIRFYLPEAGHVYIRTYNVVGALIELKVSEDFTAGEHVIELNMENYAPGVYSYKFDCNGFTDIKPMVKY